MIFARSLAAVVATGYAVAAFALPAGAVPIGAAAAGPARLPAVSRRDLTDLGIAPASTSVRIAVTLRYRNEAELDALVRSQSTPGSPFFHRYLKAAQFAAAFAPSAADYARVVASLQAAGFRVGPPAPNRTVIDAIASAPVASRYFATQIHRVNQANHGIRYANVTPAVIPAAIAPAVTTVLGIDDVVKVRPHNVRAAAPDLAPYAASADAIVPAAAQPIERTVGGKFAGIYPRGIEDAYDFPTLAGYSGAGHSVAIVIDSDIAQTDLTTFWKAAGVKRTGNFYRVLVEGTNPGVTGDVGETAVDTETSSSLAPAADIYVFLIPSLSDAAIEDAYNLAVYDNVVDVTSSSFGGCELDDTPFATATDAIAVQGAAEGMTFTASSGDAGGYCEDQTSQGALYYEPDIVNIPASDPHFVAVGATALKINKSTGARTAETAWSPGGSAGGGGGGVSSFWGIPSYQSGVPGMAVVPTIHVNPPDSQPNSGFAGRNLPDVSLDGSNAPGSYIAVYDTPDGGWTGYGGTSVSNPMFATLVAEQNQLSGVYLGFVNPVLYSTFASQGYGGLYQDVTSGSIGAGWTARAGYDQATGIGTFYNAAL